MRFEFEPKFLRASQHNPTNPAGHCSLRVPTEKQIPPSAARAADAAKKKERATTLGMTMFLAEGQKWNSEGRAKTRQTTAPGIS